MNYFKLSLIGLLIFAIGSAAGYYFSPEKIKTVNKIVEKEVVKTVHEKYDPSTGKIIERTTTDDTKNTSDTSTKVETLKPKKQYAIKAGAVVDPRDSGKLSPRVGAEVRLPFFDSWAGAEVDGNLSHPNLCGYLRLEF